MWEEMNVLYVKLLSLYFHGVSAVNYEYIDKDSRYTTGIRTSYLTEGVSESLQLGCKSV
jgi:hypothetical protein